MNEKAAGYRIHRFPKTRIATNDVCAVGIEKHHIPALLEIDVTEARKKIKAYKREKGRISFTAWLIKTIAITISDHDYIAAYSAGRRKLVIFKDINVSLLVEKEINGQRVPVPLVIEKAHERTIESITLQVNEARNQEINQKDIVLQKRSTLAERSYFMLPGFLRRSIWRFMLRRPHMAFTRMGNVAVTSVGMIGRANGWFIPISVHPACFGIGKTVKKPVFFPISARYPFLPKNIPTRNIPKTKGKKKESHPEK